jgi:competence protein ComEA
MKKLICILMLAVVTWFTYSGASLAAISFDAASDSAQMKMQKVNLNTATADQLVTLPGVGKKKAAAIIEYRKINGKFKSIQDLAEVKGIGEKMIEKLNGRLAVN